MTIENRLLHHEDVSLGYRKLRRGDSHTALLMIHGLASNASRWSEFMEHSELDLNWDLIAIDLRGHGASTPRCYLSHARYADDLQAVLTSEGYQKVVVVGHSLGAQTAIHFASRYPKMVEGLVLIDPVFSDALSAGSLRTIVTRLSLRLLIPLVRVANCLGVYRRHIPIRDLYALDRHMRALMFANTDTDIGRHYAHPLDDLKYISTISYLQDWRELLQPLPPIGQLTLPILVLLSKGERLSDHQRLQQHLNELPNAEQQTFEANHWLLTEMPHEARSAIEAWCEKEWGNGVK